MRIWTDWYPALHTVPIDADVQTSCGVEGVKRAGAFFSGGVDSFFTAIRGVGPEARREDDVIDDLITVWGFDIPLENAAAFKRVRDLLARAAEDLGKGFISVATNLRTRRWAVTEWTRLSHGAALASVALILESRYRRVFVPSSMTHRDMKPWGSHPLVDPLFSTSELRIVYDGIGYDRVMKLQLLINSDVAMRTLRVCWRSATGINCSACEKCYRNMLILHLLDALERCKTFDTQAFDVSRIRYLYIDPAHVWPDAVRRLATEQGRGDIVRALTWASYRSRVVDQVLALSARLQRVRGVHRLASSLQRITLARTIF
jgi:hypothetical protein